jgi:hypothetical protein
MKRRRKLSNIYQHPLWIIVEERGQVAVSLGDGVFILFFGGGGAIFFLMAKVNISIAFAYFAEVTF